MTVRLYQARMGNSSEQKKVLRCEYVCNACFKCNKSKLKSMLSEFSLETKIKKNNSVERGSATYTARQTQPITTVSEAEYIYKINKNSKNYMI